jgi:hypothetical protein
MNLVALVARHFPGRTFAPVLVFHCLSSEINYEQFLNFDFSIDIDSVQRISFTNSCYEMF